jgi:fructose-1-phosphate kinase PfkB-like protein
MIVTVTPNLALDVTYEVPELRPGHAHRVRAVHSRAGGKGVNVARVLALLGHDVMVLGLAGGPTGDAVRADLDASGEPLRRAAPYAWAVKPNAEELAAVTGTDDPVAGARMLGARTVVMSLGAEGLLAVTGEEVHRVPPPRVVTGNPTGAGDAVVAALAAGAGSPWPDLLGDAAALSAAAVLAPLAGSYDSAAYERFRACPSSPREK